MAALPPSAGIIGWPVAHSKSPLIHRFWLAKLDIDGDYGRFPVAPDRLCAATGALGILGLRGVNVTVPHKVAVMAFLDRIAPTAAQVGAVNTIVVTETGLVGHNTDVVGVAEALAGVELRDASIVLIGAGGAARAAVAALSGCGCQELLVVARDADRAVELIRPFDVFGGGVPFSGLASVLATADLIINASPLGMVDQPGFDDAAIDAIARSSHAVVFDMVYAPLETRLLAAARAHRLHTIDGLAMLIGQAAAAFVLFYGAAAPREFDAELRAILTIKPL